MASSGRVAFNTQSMRGAASTPGLQRKQSFIAVFWLTVIPSGRTTMHRFSSHLIAIAAVALTSAAVHAAPLNKCVANGSVTYQQLPCPSNLPSNAPTLEELRAAAKQRRAAAAANPSVAAPAMAAASSGFSCDGRQYCSQMQSCAQAKYFLANCPGVKMDGDHNGVPCEKQWCAR